MALKKLMQTASGHACEYWRLASIQQDHVARTGRMVLVGYRDQDARDAGLLPLGDATFIVDGYIGHETTTAQAYGFLKSHRRLIEAKCEHTNHETGEKWIQPAKYEDGPFFKSEDC